MRIKLKCGEALWKTALSTMTNQQFKRKTQWERLYKENTINYSIKDGDQLFNQEEISLLGDATNITKAFKQETETTLLTAKTTVLS